MRSLSRGACISALLLGLAACGGGGGGGGGGNASPAASGEVPATIPAPSTAILLNGGAAAPDGNGVIAVKPGDTIEVTASPEAVWSDNSAALGTITLLKTSITGSKWSAQLVNTKPAEQIFTVSAKLKSADSATKTLSFKVAAGDARNDTYRAFTGNGTEVKLALNFDIQTYGITDVAGARINSGTIVADTTQAGTYLFKDALTQSLPVNNARFRVGGDAIVGSYPFPAATSPTTFQSASFVAARSFVTSQADLAGTYNRIDISFTPSGGLPSLASRVRQVQIGSGGTELLMCDETVTISRLASCAGSILHYTAAAAPVAGNWVFTNTANASDKLAFAIARVNGENIYLQAGTTVAPPATNVFGIGFPETSAWPASVSYGGDGQGGWSTYTFSASSFSGAGVTFSGTSATATYPFMATAPSQPAGLRVINQNPAVFFALQSSKLVAMVGASNGMSAWYGGYLQLGLAD